MVIVEIGFYKMKQETFLGIFMACVIIIIGVLSSETHKTNQLLTNQIEITQKLEKENTLLHQTQDLEHFLMMLLNPDQKKDFLTVEEYCRQFFMEHRK